MLELSTIAITTLLAIFCVLIWSTLEPSKYGLNKVRSKLGYLSTKPLLSTVIFILLLASAFILLPKQNDTSSQLFTLISLTWFALLIGWEWFRGRYKNGRKTWMDWKIFGLSLSWLTFIERPLIYASVWGLALILIPQAQGSWAFIENHYFWPTLIAFILIDELLHGAIHRFAHSPRPKYRWLLPLHAHYRGAHRMHHLNGDNLHSGQISATHTICVSWGWAFSLPNYWFGAFCTYMGLIEVWAVGTLMKSLWGIHNHANLTYDLRLLNHYHPWVRKTMRALCHIFVFPNQHHQHHSRSKHSAKNIQNFIALYDWLLWGTLFIANKRPDVYGWRHRGKEADNALYRFFHR